MKSWYKYYCRTLFYVAFKRSAFVPPFEHMMQASRFHHLTFTGIPKSVVLSPYLVSQLPALYECHYSTAGGAQNSDVADQPKSILTTHGPHIPPTPTTCCMSGCQNCVWLKYAEDLQKTLRCSSDENRRLILSKIEDPQMRAFLELELTFMSGSRCYRPKSDEDVEA